MRPHKHGQMPEVAEQYVVAVEIVVAVLGGKVSPGHNAGIEGRACKGAIDTVLAWVGSHAEACARVGLQEQRGKKAHGRTKEPGACRDPGSVVAVVECGRVTGVVWWELWLRHLCLERTTR